MFSCSVGYVPPLKDKLFFLVVFFAFIVHDFFFFVPLLSFPILIIYQAIPSAFLLRLLHGGLGVSPMAGARLEPVVIAREGTATLNQCPQPPSQPERGMRLLYLMLHGFFVGVYLLGVVRCIYRFLG